MSKPWNPRRETVKLGKSNLGKSRIRRDPVPLSSEATAAGPRTAVRSREAEIWGGMAGILLIAAAVTAAIFGIGFATFSNGGAATGKAARFGQCYNAGGPECVLDGGTIYVGGEKIAIAGMAAPAIQSAACPEEASLGIEAAGRIAGLLNSGRVEVGASFRDEYGRDVRRVQVKGRDVADTMIAAGLARRYRGEPIKWCGSSAG